MVATRSRQTPTKKSGTIPRPPRRRAAASKAPAPAPTTPPPPPPPLSLSALSLPSLSSFCLSLSPLSLAHRRKCAPARAHTWPFTDNAAPDWGTDNANDANKAAPDIGIIVLPIMQLLVGAGIPAPRRSTRAQRSLSLSLSSLSLSPLSRPRICVCLPAEEFVPAGPRKNLCDPGWRSYARFEQGHER